MRAIQLDDRAALESKCVWLCASCQTCTARCPQNLDIAAIMDVLRIEALRAGLPPAVPDVEVFSPPVPERTWICSRARYRDRADGGAERRNAQAVCERVARARDVGSSGRLKLLPEMAKAAARHFAHRAGCKHRRLLPGLFAPFHRKRIRRYDSPRGGRAGPQTGRAAWMDLLRLNPGAHVRPPVGHGPSAAKPGDDRADGSGRRDGSVQRMLCAYEECRADREPGRPCRSRDREGDRPPLSGERARSASD